MAPVRALAAGLQVLVEEVLNGLEKLHAVHHRVRAFATLDVTPVEADAGVP
jgi:hypothetical protein